MRASEARTEFLPYFAVKQHFDAHCDRRDVKRRNWERSRNWASVHTTYQCLFSSSICRCAHAHRCRGQEQDPSVSRPQHHRHHLWHHHHQPIHRFTRLCCQPGELLSNNFKVMHQQCWYDVTELIGQFYVIPFSSSLHAKVKTAMFLYLVLISKNAGWRVNWNCAEVARSWVWLLMGQIYRHHLNWKIIFFLLMYSCIGRPHSTSCFSP